jgi:2-polyprenyl-6-hydroxyphenyl methylase/3-demethylubiquinone-9 3-methyltransferase
VFCKVCGADTSVFGSVDFNKHCDEKRSGKLPRSGIQVPYHRCRACQFVFTDAFDGWSSDDFAERIYNDEYVKVDPDYVEGRPNNNANDIIRLFGSRKEKISCLDYGGGNGLLAKRLRKASFKRAETYDEYNPATSDVPKGPFNLVSCFEVFEHERDPHRLVGSLDELLDDEGLIYFSTLLQPKKIEEFGVAWWYISPRNGHVSIYSRRALNLLLLQYELNWASFNSAFHVAWRHIPAFGAELIARLEPGGP